jgi:hypothetical protein
VVSRIRSTSEIRFLRARSELLSVGILPCCGQSAPKASVRCFRSTHFSGTTGEGLATGVTESWLLKALPQAVKLQRSACWYSSITSPSAMRAAMRSWQVTQ